MTILDAIIDLPICYNIETCAVKGLKFLGENEVEVGTREVEEAMVSIRFFVTQMNRYEKRCELMTQLLNSLVNCLIRCLICIA